MLRSLVRRLSAGPKSLLAMRMRRTERPPPCPLPVDAKWQLYSEFGEQVKTKGKKCRL